SPARVTSPAKSAPSPESRSSSPSAEGSGEGEGPRPPTAQSARAKIVRAREGETGPPLKALCKDPTHSLAGDGARGRPGGCGSGAKGPVPDKRAADVERRDGAQSSGPTNACRVVVSPPTRTRPAAPAPRLPARALDDAASLPPSEILARMTEQTDEDVFVVLARHGSEPAHLARRFPALERGARVLHAPVRGMFHLHEHPTRSHLRIVDHLDDVVDGRRGDAARRQHPDHFRAGSLPRPTLDNHGDLGPAVTG